MKTNQKTFFILALAIIFPATLITVRAQDLPQDICDLIKEIAALIEKTLAQLAEVIKCIKQIIDAGIKTIQDLITQLNKCADDLKDRCCKRGVDITACVDAERACVAKIKVTSIKNCAPNKAIEKVKTEIQKLKTLSDLLHATCKGKVKSPACKKLEAAAKKQEKAVQDAIKAAQATKGPTQACVDKQVAILTAQVKKCEDDLRCCVRDCCGL